MSTLSNFTLWIQKLFLPLFVLFNLEFNFFSHAIVATPAFLIDSGPVFLFALSSFCGEVDFCFLTQFESIFLSVGELW